MKTSSTTNRAFTLIELLTVIAIIGVLVALLFPAIRSAILKAEISKAQTAISSSLAIAFQHYYTEYGKWPAIESDPTKSTIYISTEMVGLLKGEDINGSVAGGFDTNALAVTYNGNPRHIGFLEFKAADLVIPSATTTTNFVDPWKGIYRCRFNSTYDNQIPNPFLPYLPAPNTPVVNAGVLIWSAGPDGLDDPNCGDPPGPYTEPPRCVNRDNVKSW